MLLNNKKKKYNTKSKRKINKKKNGISVPYVCKIMEKWQLGLVPFIGVAITTLFAGTHSPQPDRVGFKIRPVAPWWV